VFPIDSFADEPLELEGMAVRPMSVLGMLAASTTSTGRCWPRLALGIELSSTFYSGALAVAAFTTAPAPLGAYGSALSIAWPGLTAWVSLMIKRLFTSGIARTVVSPEIWSGPVFHRTNPVSTAVWATSFTLGAGLLAALVDAAAAVVIAVEVAGSVLPALFTVRCSNAARRAGTRA
jgi:hypothetical protein